MYACGTVVLLAVSLLAMVCLMEEVGISVKVGPKNVILVSQLRGNIPVFLVSTTTVGGRAAAD